MTSKKPFWDVEEKIGFVNIKAWDDLNYRVWNQGTPESLQQVANILADIRYDINRLLVCLYKNRNKWINTPIAWGIYHTFNIHANGCDENVFNNINASDLINKQSIFNYQEMTPNSDGILGLNKPKKVKNINLQNGKPYEISTKRAIFLTIRPKLSNNGNPDVFDSYSKILDLAIHELTHTTCNDTRWKKDNHQHPYPQYHKIMRQFAQSCGVLNK